LCQAAQMADICKRTTLLLGAGASVDADIPSAFPMTQRIVAALASSESGLRESLALNMVVSAISMHDASRGVRAAHGVDVERVFSAVRMLRDRHHMELTPFVESWNTNLDRIVRMNSPETHSGWDYKLRSAITSIATVSAEKSNYRRGNHDNLEGAMYDAVRHIVGNPESSEVFVMLERRILSQLLELLAVDPAKVSYLRPVLALPDPTINIVSLNYDRTIEVMCEQSDVSYDTGIDHWSGGFRWEWNEDARVRLLKLHGSADWLTTSERQSGKMPTERTDHIDNAVRDMRSDRPAMIFGQRGKLRHDGPYLAMLYEYERLLTATDHLVIVGYSMRDDHVNTSIVHWMNSRVDAEVTIIDPDASGGFDNHGFRHSLMAMANDPDNTRIRVLPRFAADGLNELFAEEQAAPSNVSDLGEVSDSAVSHSQAP
jgi:hypothetical protein